MTFVFIADMEVMEHFISIINLDVRLIKLELCYRDFVWDPSVNRILILCCLDTHRTLSERKKKSLYEDYFLFFIPQTAPIAKIVQHC